MEGKLICSMTVQLSIDCSGVVLHISREFSHNLFHVPPLFQPRKFESEENCTTHEGKNGKRETVGVAPSVALVIIFVFQIALCDDPFIMAVVHYPASHLALSFILTSA